MNKFKKGDYIVFKHPNLAYSEEQRNDNQGLYGSYLNIYNIYKSKKHKIEQVDADGVAIILDDKVYKIYFNEIEPAIKKTINKIKIL